MAKSALNQLKKVTITATLLNGSVLKAIEYSYVQNALTMLTDPSGIKYGRGGDSNPMDVHGNYCGPAATGQRQEPFEPSSSEQLLPEDGLNNACMYHDLAYGDVHNDLPPIVRTRMGCGGPQRSGQI